MSCRGIEGGGGRCPTGRPGGNGWPFCPHGGRNCKEKAGELLIFEQIDRPRGDLLPASRIGDLLPDCQVALITATSIINGTIDDLLTAAKNCREVVILGASTPLLPEIFQDTPVTCLSGVAVNDPEAVLKVVSCGGGMRSFKPHARKVNLKLKKI